MAFRLLWGQNHTGEISHTTIVERGPKQTIGWAGGSDVRNPNARTLVLFRTRFEDPLWDPGLEKPRSMPLGFKEALEFVWEWLQNEDPRDQDLRDQDVGQSPGFLAFNEEWGHIALARQAFAAFRPIHAWFGK